MLHLYAHNHKNYVKKGDKVKKYKTLIGNIGNANGDYWAHLHYSVSDGLSEPELKKYVNGWSEEDVKLIYTKPICDFSKMFNEKVDVGMRGYDWLQNYGKGFHPGVDVNGLGGGNTDIGYKFKSACDGTVVYAGDWGKGWGKVVIVESESEVEPEDLHVEGDEDFSKLEEAELAKQEVKQEVKRELERIVSVNKKLRTDLETCADSYDEILGFHDDIRVKYEELKATIKTNKKQLSVVDGFMDGKKTYTGIAITLLGVLGLGGLITPDEFDSIANTAISIYGIIVAIYGRYYANK